MEEKKIPYSKAAILVAVFGCAIAVMVGVHMIIGEASEVLADSKIKSILLIRGMGWFCTIFGGWFGLIGISKIFTRRPGVLLNNEGFGKRYYGKNIFIYWDDIEKIDWYKTGRQKIIRVELRDNSRYKVENNAFVRLWSKAEKAVSGSHITLASNPFSIGFDDLLELLQSYLEESRKSVAVIDD